MANIVVVVYYLPLLLHANTLNFIILRQRLVCLGWIGKIILKHDGILASKYKSFLCFTRDSFTNVIICEYSVTLCIHGLG